MGKAILEKYVSFEEWEEEYFLCTNELRRISNYTGMNFNEVLDLPYSVYLLYKKESWIYAQYSNEEGRELLKTLWRLKQTKANTKKIRKFQHRKEAN